MIKENEGFKIEAQEEKGCRLALKIEVKPVQTKKAYKQAIKRVSKEISIPGFRKGHAPEEMILKQYENHVEREWRDILVNDAFQMALDLVQIYPYNKNSIEKPKIEKCSLENGALVSLSYEYYPHVPLPDFATIKLPAIERKAISDNQVDDILAEIQKSHATFEDIEGRSAALGDFVDISIDKIDEEPIRSLIKERRFEISKEMLPWLQKLLIGLKVGESIEGMSAEQQETPPMKVKVTLHAIKKSLLPEINDDLAKKTGVSSKQELIANIRSNLEKDAEARLEEEKIIALEKQLLEKYSFDIPASLVASEEKARLKDRLEQLKSENLSKEEYEKRSEEIQNSISKEVDQALRLHFLFSNLAEKKGISLSKEELNTKLQQEMMSNPIYQQIQEREGNEALRKIIRRLTNHFLQEKIRQYALSQVN